MSDQSVAEGPVILTHSGLRAWWLKRVRRYKMISVRRSPKAGLFGRISYESIWTFKRMGSGKGRRSWTELK